MGKKVKSVKPDLSVIIIARNEEEKIKDCVESSKWSGEVILVDDGSTDSTVRIAKNSGVKIIKAPVNINGNYSKLRDLGLSASISGFILYVDADERVTPALQEEIVKTIVAPGPGVGLWVIPRRNFILGKELKHGGWWPDYVKRLYRKESLQGWSGNLHEEPRYQGNISYMREPLIHMKHDNLSEMVEKTNKWSEVEAKLMFDAGHPPMNIARFSSAIVREFWLRMIKERGYMDGPEGTIYALYQVFSKFLSYAKLWEMQLK